MSLISCTTRRLLRRTLRLQVTKHTQGGKIRVGDHRGQTFAHARVVVRVELSARTKTEEKYTSERLHKALEKRVNKITRG